jgi:mono/diheme cytochrome c family protein
MPAPPHDETGHTWHHADGQLFTITKQGVGAVVPGYESDMPAFGDSLTDAEIRAALAYIKSTWPERERAFQAEVTAKAEAGQ